LFRDISHDHDDHHNIEQESEDKDAADGHVDDPPAVPPQLKNDSNKTDAD
jgi:hypothetical protein